MVWHTVSEGCGPSCRQRKVQQLFDGSSIHGQQPDYRQESEPSVKGRSGYHLPSPPTPARIHILKFNNLPKTLPPPGEQIFRQESIGGGMLQPNLTGVA